MQIGQFARSRRRLVVSLGATAVALAGLVGCGGPGAIAQPTEALGTAADITVPAAIRNIPLTEPDGTKTSLAAFQGKPVMIADYLTLCTDICPMISANTVAMSRALTADGYGGGKVALLEITVDPHRDTPARMRAYQKLYGGPQPDWTLLRANKSNTAKLWKYFGVEYQKVKEPHPASIDWLTHKPLTYDIDHSDALIFLDARGHERFVVNDGPDVQGHLPPAKLVRFLNGEGVTDLYHPNKVTTWTVGDGLDVLSWLLNHRLAGPA